MVVVGGVVEGSIAYAIENYNYTIVIAKDSKEFTRKCITTTVLKKENNVWIFPLAKTAL